MAADKPRSLLQNSLNTTASCEMKLSVAYLGSPPTLLAPTRHKRILGQNEQKLKNILFKFPFHMIWLYVLAPELDA